MRNILLLLIFMFLRASCNAQSTTNLADPSSPNEKQPISPRFSKIYDSSKVEHFDPFLIYKDGSFMIAAETDLKTVSEKYRPIFTRNGYLGSGFSWEGLIKLILEHENPELFSHVEFDAEGGGFYAFADSETAQREFAVLLSGIFTNLPRLEEYLKAADRTKIDN